MSKEITDYLTKQIFIEKNIVSYRLLSRQFKIHVNQAKKELNTFHASTRGAVEHSYATYLISGEPNPPPPPATPYGGTQYTDMEVDDEVVEEEIEYDDDCAEDVPAMKITMVAERNLEATRENYARIYSEHIYCLSPSPIIDPALVAGPSDAASTLDRQLSPEESSKLGRITGPHVKHGKYVKPAMMVRAEKALKKSAAEAAAKKEEKSKAAGSSKAEPVEGSKQIVVPKPKASGKLDWSKAKTKATKAEEPIKVKTEKAKEDKLWFNTGKKSEVKRESVSNSDDAKTTIKASNGNNDKKSAASKSVKDEKPKAESSKSSKLSGPTEKRGTKRKSALPVDSGSEAEGQSGSTSRERTATPIIEPKRADVKVKRNAIVSDDEDEDDSQPKPPVKTKGKAKAQYDIDLDSLPTRSERSLKAIMDLDDDQVERVVHKRKPVAKEPSPEPEPEEEPEADEDVEMAMEDDDVVEAKPKRTRKKKEKKLIPVGKNGLKKKRIVKSRMRMENGYMVTEDYSEYESVSEEEPEEPKVKKAPAKVKTEEKPAKVPKEKPGSTTSSATKEEPKKSLKPGQLKRSGSSASSKVVKKGSIMNFFGKK